MTWQPIPVPASAVKAAGITPGRFAIWALQKAHDDKPEQALRLLRAAEAMVRDDIKR